VLKLNNSHLHNFFTIALDFYLLLFTSFCQSPMFIFSDLLLGSAIGFRLDSLLKLTETRARDKKMTLMHYLCKVHVANYSVFFFFFFFFCKNVYEFLVCYGVTCNIKLGEDCSFFHLLILR